MASKSFGTEISRRPSAQNRRGGTIGEVNDLRADAEAGFTKMETPGNGGTNLLAVDEWTDPALADVDGLLAAAATVAAIVTVSSFLAPGVAALAAGPRKITFTTAGVTASDAPATAVVTGEAINGDAQSETVNISQTAATVSTAKYYAGATTIVFAAADGTDATVAIGFGAGLGLHSKIKSRAGAVAVLMENEAGTVKAGDALAGTYEDAATAPPNGGYTPGTAADGSNDYAVWYERDLS